MYLNSNSSLRHSTKMFWQIWDTNRDTVLYLLFVFLSNPSHLAAGKDADAHLSVRKPTDCTETTAGNPNKHMAVVWDSGRWRCRHHFNLQSHTWYQLQHRWVVMWPTPLVFETLHSERPLLDKSLNDIFFFSSKEFLQTFRIILIRLKGSRRLTDVNLHALFSLITSFFSSCVRPSAWSRGNPGTSSVVRTWLLLSSSITSGT